MNFAIKITALLLLSIIIFATYSCNKNNIPDTTKETVLNLPEKHFDYSRELGNHFRNTTINYNEEDNKKIELGRVLFHDTKLSINNTVSCSSCHLQQHAFSDNVAFSEGFREAVTLRNSMPIFNDAFENRFFWDNSARGLENQVLLPIGNHIEMGIEDNNYLVDKLSLTEYYNQMFLEAYSRTNFGVNEVRDALARFVGSIYSANSKYDKAYKNNFEDFTQQERKGLSLYLKSGCNGCHNLEIDESALMVAFSVDELLNENDFRRNLGLTGGETANIGLDLVYDDNGAGQGSFKTPSVRNVELTAPYMHDGRFETLEEVIEHYNEGIQPHESLDCRLTGQCNSYEDAISTPNKNEPIQFDFDNEEQQALVAFLKTLTDNELVNNQFYSNPFNN